MTRILCALVLVFFLFPQSAFPQVALTPVRMDSKWGYANVESGEVEILPQFEKAGRFSEGLAPVMLNERYGFIDARGKVVIEPAYAMARPFSEKLAAVSIEGKFGFIDTNGGIAIAPRYEWAGDFHNDRALVRVDRRYGYINRVGELVIPAVYVQARPFSGRLAAAATEPDKFVFIDTMGNRVTESTWADAGGFRDGVAWVKSDTGLFGFINPKGEFAIKPKFAGLGSFHRGVAPALVGKKWCFVDSKGNQLTEAMFDEAVSLHSSIYARNGDKRVFGRVRADGSLEMKTLMDPWLANVEFESKPTMAAIYKPPMMEYELEPADDKSRLLIPEYRVSRGDTNISDKLDTRQEYMILFVIPNKPMQARKCVPGVDPKISAVFP